MADADEDIIPRSHPSFSLSDTSTPSNDPSTDPEDEAQDFRFLAALTSKTTSATIPKRGEKDFEPNPTQAQSNTLAASRDAMHNALSVERVLPPNNSVVGQYLPDSKDWRWDVMPDGEEQGKGGRCVVVERFRTTYAKSIGVADYRNWSWLLPEEALFLVERGTLDIRWPDDKVRAFMKGSMLTEGEGDSTSPTTKGEEDRDDDSDGDYVAENGDEQDEKVAENENGTPRRKKAKHTPLQVGEMPMSLQGAYASFIGKSGLTMERYNVYAGLRRLGYIVQRASTWDDGDKDNDYEKQHTNGSAAEPDGHLSQPLLATTLAISRLSHPQTNPATSLINRLVSYLFTPKPLHYQPAYGPLIYPGLYQNYTSIFRALTIIPFYTSTSAPDPTSKPKPQPPFSISWHVYKPSPNTKFRKSAPPPPDFRVAVLDARTSSIPTAAQIGPLLDSMPEDRLNKDKKMEMRLKHGVQNVVLAIVDCGLVSYLRLADVCSGNEGRVADTKVGRGGKKGGGWRRGGGGRGRGGKR